MNLTNKEYKSILAALMLLPQGEAFKMLNEEAQQTIIEADRTMVGLLRKQKEQNRKTAAYIAGRRKTDKNYARSRKED